ncbi:hypothetical protein M0R88_17340 [Halorussus gelatinilyticus]|uniref:Uncharacterized protein n=1 Tax=Halorussus gelatinilyticus TaxID=2937524 RepID=A0A8U0IGP5_9EURY|nr:hypothetical protein [Halorussus gelatinilyticus]UPW00260.1 hypothetical protein M0R88_17340 [Halorussus gelatinilyticus]
MAQVPARPLTTLLVGAAVLLVGYLVKYRGWTSLIAGVAPLDAETPLPVFVSYVGNVTLVAGGFVVCVGLAQALGVLSLVPGWLRGALFVAVVVLVAPRLSVRATEV